MRPAMQRRIRAIFSFYFRILHGVALQGLEHLPKPGEAAVLVVNHQSLADGCFVATFLPGSPMFAVSRDMARRWWARPFLAVVRSFAVDPTNAIAVKSMIAAVHEGNSLVMFPEGRITTTGSLMKIYDGAATVADRAHAKLIVIRIDGLQRTRLSRMAGSTRLRWFPRLSMTVLPPIPIAVDPALRGRARRSSVGDVVRRSMQQAEFEAANTSRSLFAALLETISCQGGSIQILEDESRSPLTYQRFLDHVCALGNCLARDITAGEVVGLMVPNSVEMVTAFMALHALGAIPVMLDTKACARTNLRSCAAAGAHVILVSRAVGHADLNRNAGPEMKNGPRLIWLEDIMPHAGLVRAARLRGSFGAARLPGNWTPPEAPAAMLLAKDECGSLQMAQLSHRDILAMIARSVPQLAVNSGDRFMTTVSAAEAFGLTLGVLLPLLSGAKLFVAPSASPSWKTLELVYDTDSTVVVTDHETLETWTAWAEPHDFYRTRLCLTRDCVPPMLRHALDAVGLAGRLMSEAELNLLRARLKTCQGSRMVRFFEHRSGAAI